MKPIHSRSNLLIGHSNKKYLVIMLMFVIAMLSAGYFYFRTKSINILTNTTFIQNKSTQELKSKWEPITLTGTFYIGPNPYHLEYEAISDYDINDIPEKGRYVLVGIHPEKVKYTLHEEDYNVCNIPAITYQSFNRFDDSRNVTRFLIEYSCGDYPVKKVLGAATNFDDSKLIVLPAITIDQIDKYLEKHYKTIGWYTPEELIFNEISYDKTTGKETHSRLIKLNINQPNTITPL